MNITKEDIQRMIREEIEGILGEENKTAAEGGICKSGEDAANRKYKKWSAYAAMYASRYCKDKTFDRGKSKKDESLEEGGELKKWRDENWTQSDGTPCGDNKAQKNPKRCKPAKKWGTMSKGEKAADNAKKKAGGKKGEQWVSGTKKGKVSDKNRKSARKDESINEDELEEGGKCTKVTKKASSTRDKKKWMKCVKSDSGGFKRIHWGQAGVRVTGDSGDTDRKKSFKARHKCGSAKANTPQGQACKDWAE